MPKQKRTAVELRAKDARRFVAGVDSMETVLEQAEVLSETWAAA